ncbi:MAG: histidine phosphatase family protein [Planctomycetaceae bacterium]
MRRVILVRHGESLLNAMNEYQKILCGQFDTPLTDRGREQARNVGKILMGRTDLNITHAVSSTLSRTRETLDLALQQFSDRPEVLTPNAGFNERSLGIFEGRLEEDVFREYPNYRSHPQYCRFREHFEQKAPCGENLAEVTERAWAAFEAARDCAAADLLIVSHCNTIRCLLGRALRLPQAETAQLPIRHATPIILKGDRDFQMESGFSYL